MASTPPTDLDLDTYVAILVALSLPEANPEDVLTKWHLDPAAWDVIDANWQGRIDDAMEQDLSEGVPPLLEAYARAFAEAQRAVAGDVAPFEQFLEIAHAVQRGESLTDTLKRAGMSLEDYLKTHQHWTIQMTTNPDLLLRFRSHQP